MCAKSTKHLETTLLNIYKFNGDIILLNVEHWCENVFFREFAKTIKRPFTVRYNPYTQSVDVLKDTPSINSVVEELRHELDIVGDALSRLNKQLGVWQPGWGSPLSASMLAMSSPSTAVEILLVTRPSSLQWMCIAIGKMLFCSQACTNYWYRLGMFSRRY